MGRWGERVEDGFTFPAFVYEFAASCTPHAEWRHQADCNLLGTDLFWALRPPDLRGVEVGWVVLAEHFTFGHVC